MWTPATYSEQDWLLVIISLQSPLGTLLIEGEDHEWGFY